LKDVLKAEEDRFGKQQADVEAVVLCCAVLFLILTLCAIKWNINLVNIFVVQSINEP